MDPFTKKNKTNKTLITTTTTITTITIIIITTIITVRTMLMNSTVDDARLCDVRFEYIWRKALSFI